MDSYATFFTEKANSFEKFKDQVPWYQNAVRLREKQMTLDTSAALRIAVANEYTILGYSQLFLPDGKAAEESLRRAIELDPENKYACSNLAPALMLQGKYKEAEAEYKKWAPLHFVEDFTTYRDIFLDNLKTMEEQGVPGFDFARVRGWLAE